MISLKSRNRIARQVRALWRSPRITELRATAARWHAAPYSGLLVLLAGTLVATLFIMLFDRGGAYVTNPGLFYLPLVAMLAYHWGWRLALSATALELACVYFFFLPPPARVKPLTAQSATQLLILAAVTGFTLAIVGLARQRRAHAEREAARFAALNRIGTALVSELDETRLLRQIAETARNLAGAEFAAFTLRPVNELGQPAAPSEGFLFHLAAVVGVSQEHEEFFRRTPLGGEGLLAPIYRHGVPVRVPDALELLHRPEPSQGVKARAALTAYRNAAQQAAYDYAHGHLAREGLRSLGVPQGHPIVRSFLGAPLLDREGNVRGGLLLGHSEPDQFTQEDEELLVGLAAEAAVALENARLYTAAQAQARELDAIFESIADGITLVDDAGKILRENGTARRLREQLNAMRTDDANAAEKLLQEVAADACTADLLPTATAPCAGSGLKAHGASTAAPSGGRRRSNGTGHGIQVTIVNDQQDSREFIVSASPLRPARTPPTSNRLESKAQNIPSGAVVVWHDVTEARRLLSERQAHAETEARRALLQTLINELPSSVYLVRGREARLVLANRAATELWGAAWQPGQPMQEFLAENGVRVFHVDGRPLAPGEFATLRAVRDGESVHHQQEVIRHRDGTTLPVLVNAVALDPQVLGWTNSGELSDESEYGAIVVHQDVTALKEAERLKDEFLGIAAHELRTPIAVIRGFAQMLIMQTARGKGPELADWQKEAIQDIDQATSRLVELSEDLLDVTRLQAGRLELHLEPTDLVALVRRIAARFQVTTEAHRIAIHAGPDHLVVEVDPRRIEQVASNLINNAIKYSPGGGDIEIDVHEDRHSNSALLCVRDHGIGIPADQQSRIFGRFMRAANARSNDISGTGLGLYLCRELVERQGGRIWFESVEGQGSTFFVALPLVKSDANEMPPVTTTTSDHLPA